MASAAVSSFLRKKSGPAEEPIQRNFSLLRTVFSATGAATLHGVDFDFLLFVGPVVRRSTVRNAIERIIFSAPSVAAAALDQNDLAAY